MVNLVNIFETISFTKLLLINNFVALVILCIFSKKCFCEKKYILEITGFEQHTDQRQLSYFC